MGNSTQTQHDAIEWPALPWLIGHRGAAGLVPENTLPSFERAFAEGVQAVELDVYCIEGELLVFHDDELDRTTNGQGPIQSASLAELRTLDAGDGAQIPLLGEVLNALPQSIAINIELKGKDTAKPVYQLLQRYPQIRPLISSFRNSELKSYRQLDSQAPLGLLRHRWPPAPWPWARRLAPWSVNLNVQIATAKRVRKIHAAGYRCFVYTVNDIEVAKQLLEMGVDGLFTDRPDRLRKLFK